MKLTEDNFEIVNYYWSEKEVLKCSEQLKQQILENQRLRELVEKSLEKLNQEDCGGDWVMVRRNLLQSLLVKAKYCWKERHYKIAQESNEKFKTHTKEDEIDI